jgi:hypothetical protein
VIGIVDLIFVVGVIGWGFVFGVEGNDPGNWLTVGGVVFFVGRGIADDFK